MRYKAVFFDRDGTLAHNNPERQQWMRETVSGWSGKPFDLPYEKMMALMERASEGRKPWYRDVADEKEFRVRYYRHLLAGEGVRGELDARAATLFDAMWHENNPMILYPEVREVLRYFRAHGYRMGVISDTSPSLELTLQNAGIAGYFTSFTASSLVGAMKPSPIIFHAALSAQGVTAAESLYVDDYDVEADGAREQGFTSFLIDREGKNGGPWAIRNLMEMVDFVEREG